MTRRTMNVVGWVIALAALCAPAAAQDDSDDPAWPAVRVLGFSGPLCGDVYARPRGDYFELNIFRYVQGPTEATCTVRIELDIPPGLQLNAMTFVPATTILLHSEDVQPGPSEITFEYALNGQRSVKAEYVTPPLSWRSPPIDRGFTHHTGLSTPACDPERPNTATLTIQVTADVEAGTTFGMQQSRGYVRQRIRAALRRLEALHTMREAAQSCATSQREGRLQLLAAGTISAYGFRMGHHDPRGASTCQGLRIGPPDLARAASAY